MPVTEVVFSPSREMPQPNPGGQTAFANDWTHRFVAAEGGWGSGKTWVGAHKFVSLHIANSMDPETGEPTRVPSALLGPTYRNIYDIDIPAVEAACAEAGLDVLVLSTKSEIVLPDLGTKANPSVIMVRSADKPELITGWEVGAFWGDEPTRWREDRVNPKRDPFIQILGRLRHPKARIRQGLFTYTNEGDATRVYEEFNAGKPDFALYRIATRENPLMVEFEDAQRRVLTPELARQYLDGEAVSLRGRNAYAMWDPSQNQHAVELQHGNHVCVFIDFNINPGMYFGIGQHWPEKDLFTVPHEVYEDRLDIRRGVPKIARLIADHGGMKKFGHLEVYGDATGRSEWAGTSESCYTILRQCLDKERIPYKIKVPSENPPIHDRVNAVNVAMLDVEGQPHFKVHPDRCPRLKRDLQHVRWDSTGAGLDKSNPLLTHSSDAVGYWIHYVRPARVRPKTVVGGRFGV